MAKPIHAKKGSPEFEAAFSLTHEVTLYLKDNKTKVMEHIRLKMGKHPKFSEAVALIKEHSVEISVEEVSLFNNTLIFTGMYALHKFGEIAFTDITLLDASVYTKDIKAIKSLAKEIRSDIAVANVSKKPAKPKAGMKTRKDTI